MLKPDSIQLPPVLRAGRHSDIAAALALEQATQIEPWTQQNLQEAWQQGYCWRVLTGVEQPQTGLDILGHVIALQVLDEMQLLSIAVLPACQGRGWARALLLDLKAQARQHQCQHIFCEVRVSNERALRVYLALGFAVVGLRPRFYAAHTPGQAREDARLLRCRV